MASFNKINNFTFALASKLHNLGTGGDALKIALTNTAHTSTWTKLSDLTEITYTNCSTRALVQTLATTTGTAKLTITDLVLTASGGTVGPFRYVYIYNDTATNKDLIGYYDYGSAYTMADTTTFTIDFDGTNGVLTIV